MRSLGVVEDEGAALARLLGLAVMKAPCDLELALGAVPDELLQVILCHEQIAPGVAGCTLFSIFHRLYQACAPPAAGGREGVGAGEGVTNS